MPRPDLHSLPPVARAEAMDRPYRPGRQPLWIALAITLLVHLALGLYLLLRPAAPVRTDAPPADAPPAVVYPKLHPPTAPAPPHRVAR